MDRFILVVVRFDSDFLGLVSRARVAQALQSKGQLTQASALGVAEMLRKYVIPVNRVFAPISPSGEAIYRQGIRGFTRIKHSVRFALYENGRTGHLVLKVLIKKYGCGSPRRLFDGTTPYTMLFVKRDGTWCNAGACLDASHFSRV
jgi:hypothetical protein